MAVTPRPPASGATRAQTPPPDPSGASTGELIGRLGDQLTRLVRDEVYLAQAEVTQKAKRLGIGAACSGRPGSSRSWPSARWSPPRSWGWRT